MNFIETEISGVWIIEPVRYKDARGYFCETFREDEFRAHIGPVRFVQENESMSSYGVVRGLHFQRPPHTQAKLVRVSQGEVLDVAVDLRDGSPTFGHYVARRLSAVNGLQMFVPRGFAHGFAVLSPTAQFQYKVDNYYEKASEGAIRFDDPTICVAWPVPTDKMLLSEKDVIAPSFEEYIKSGIKM